MLTEAEQSMVLTRALAPLGAMLGATFEVGPELCVGLGFDGAVEVLIGLLPEGGLLLCSPLTGPTGDETVYRRALEMNAGALPAGCFIGVEPASGELRLMRHAAADDGALLPAMVATFVELVPGLRSALGAPDEAAPAPAEPALAGWAIRG
jgi:hypothetical protein